MHGNQGAAGDAAQIDLAIKYHLTAELVATGRGGIVNDVGAVGHFDLTNEPAIVLGMAYLAEEGGSNAAIFLGIARRGSGHSGSGHKGGGLDLTDRR